jgi:hypothetical protein
MKIVILITAFMMSLNLTAQTNKCNCCTEKHSEFDFWLGSWTVTDTNGKLAGTNIIDKIQDNCILRENWTSAQGNFTGTSTNFYNTITKQWEQIWLDNQGGILHLKGNRIENQMILQSDERKNTNGEPYFNRITWTLNDDGTVRQYWETITNGKDVIVAFDGLYKKTQ